MSACFASYNFDAVSVRAPGARFPCAAGILPADLFQPVFHAYAVKRALAALRLSCVAYHAAVPYEHVVRFRPHILRNIFHERNHVPS